MVLQQSAPVNPHMMSSAITVDQYYNPPILQAKEISVSEILTTVIDKTW